MPNQDEPLQLRRCMRCAKLFRGSNEHPLCHTCAEDHHALGLEEDAAMPLSEKRLQALMALYDAQAEGVHGGLIPPDKPLLHPALALDKSEFEADGECVLCGKPRLKNSGYCLDCHTRLYKEITDAAQGITSRFATAVPPPAPSVRDTLTSLESAHPRPRHVRNNPYPMGRLRPE